MDNKREIKNVNDVVARGKDFVVEYQGMDVFIEKYEMQKHELGRGAYGTVKKAIMKSNQEPRAVKIIEKANLSSNPMLPQLMISELTVL